MPLFTLSFLLGDITLQSLSYLPSYSMLVGLLLFSMIVLMYGKMMRWLAIIALGFMCGFTYSAMIAHHTLAWKLPSELEGKPQTINGIIVSLPEVKYKQTQFILKLNSSNALIQLSWPHENKNLHVGDEWQLNVKLKKIHGTQNEAGYDYDAWSYQKGLRATGYVIPYADNIKIAHHWYSIPLEQFRESMRDALMKQLPKTATAHWLMALTVGERANVQANEWTVLQKTGTNHLMAVGGLHIGMLCVLVLFFTRKRGYLTALGAAFIYSALAGFSLPTERALFMLSIFSLYTFLHYKVNHWHVWSLALLCTLLLHPASVLDQSLWLSFGTIAIIIYGMSGRLQPSGWWWKWGRVQYVIAIGLIPLSILLFQECSLVSLLANTIAIPLLEFFILPFCFLALIFIKVVPFVAHLFLSIADHVMQLLWGYLHWISQLNLAVFHISIINSFIFISLMVGIVILLMPRGASGRLFSVIFILPLLLIKPDRPKEGDVWLTVLDAGQGLSAVIETRSHTLVFDAGPSENTVALPYLRQRQIKQIDTMIISHGDMDHRGGANQLILSLPISVIYTTAPEKIKAASNLCLSGAHWQWDGVTFAFAYPDSAHLNFDNNSSCVLKVTTQTNKSILLPGDIEDYAESTIVANHATSLSADILIAPHHGSKTSINPAFISAVHPAYVVYAIGYRNRYHFPHQSTLDLYSAIHATQFNSADDGEIQFRIEKNNITTHLYRKEHLKFYL